MTSAINASNNLSAAGAKPLRANDSRIACTALMLTFILGWIDRGLGRSQLIVLAGAAVDLPIAGSLDSRKPYAIGGCVGVD